MHIVSRGEMCQWWRAYKTPNSVNSAFSHDVRVLVSFWMVFPSVLGKFQQKALSGDLTLSVCASHLQGKLLPIFKGSCFHVLLISKIPGHQVMQPRSTWVTVRNINVRLLPHIIIQASQHLMTSIMFTDQYCSRSEVLPHIWHYTFSLICFFLSSPPHLHPPLNTY